MVFYKSKKIVYSQYSDVIPIFAKDNSDSEDEEINIQEKQKSIDKTTHETKSAIDKILNPNSIGAEYKFIRYKPSRNSGQFNLGAKQRFIGIMDKPSDVLDPPKFKHKKVPKGSGSPPVPVMRSPPRPVTAKDQHYWKIPPCVSNSKNPKGYIIPLQQRAVSDGGPGLNEVRVNGNFSKLSEALYVAEQRSREAVGMRSKVLKETVMREKERNEAELRELARRARLERGGGVSINSNSDTKVGSLYRDGIRKERKRERKKVKRSRDCDRDVSEIVALGMARNGGAC
ncbi:snw/ski-interacting protein [Phtheirospermum japonicum]|uniref:Snw/ski-interacting protein n=1 Tax=Phtheirospermum japonicum TaxID=374723 RepID=A0A830CTP1_9LAMI|nr:snw/ski-interacting protein [Phtheirospermum japonicum]